MVAFPRPRAELYAHGKSGVVVMASERSALREWWTTVLLVVVGAGLGGYLGSVLALMVCITIGKVALNRSHGTAKRAFAGLLGLAIWGTFYVAGLRLYAQVLGLG